MLLLFCIFGTACGLVWINYKTSDKIAPADRIGLSLVCLGVGTMPIAIWLAFIPTIFCLLLGGAFLLAPTRQFYEQRNARRLKIEELREAAKVDADDVIMGCCPNCDAILPVDIEECPRCHALFNPPSDWKVRVP